MKQQFVFKQENTPVHKDIVMMPLGKCMMEGWNFTLQISILAFLYIT